MIFLTSTPKGVCNIFSKFCGNELNDLVPGFPVSCPITLHLTLQSFWVIPSFLVFTQLLLCPGMLFTMHYPPEQWKMTWKSQEKNECPCKFFCYFSTSVQTLLQNTQLFLSGTQQNSSQPHLLFVMAIECEWELYVLFCLTIHSFQLSFFISVFPFRWSV